MNNIVSTTYSNDTLYLLPTYLSWHHQEHYPAVLFSRMTSQANTYESYNDPLRQGY